MLEILSNMPSLPSYSGSVKTYILLISPRKELYLEFLPAVVNNIYNTPDLPPHNIFKSISSNSQFIERDSEKIKSIKTQLFLFY